jgi:c-di-GMP-specific phosphodiesterase
MVSRGRSTTTRDVAQLLKSTADVVAGTTDIHGAMQWAVEVVCGYTRWPLGHIYVLDRTTNTLSSTDIWHNDDPPRHEPFVRATRETTLLAGHGLPGRIVASGAPSWITDVRADPNFPRAEAAARAGLGAGFGFPITSSAGIEGVMEFFSREPEECDDELLDLIAHVGVQLGHLIDRSRADEALRTSEARLAEAERIGRAGSWSWAVGDDSVTWSDELYRIYGVAPTPGPVGYDQYLERVHPEDRAAVAGAVGTILATLEPYEHEYRIVRPDGAVRWVHARIEVVARRDRIAQRLAGYCQDVTERRVAEDQRRLAQLELESHQRSLERIARAEPVDGTLDALCRDIEARYEGTRCSVLLADPAQKVLHHAAAPSLPSTFREAIDGLPIASGAGACETAAALNEMVVVADTLTDPLTKTFVDLAVDHGLRSVWSHPLATKEGEVIGTFAVYRSTPHRPDDSEIRTVMTAGSLAALALERGLTEAALTAAANVDPLTGMPNRARFLEQLSAELQHPDSTVAVMFLDLDGFKWINDSLGHPAGDRVLVEVAARLERVLYPEHRVARFGGDEFTVMVTGRTPAEVDRIAERLHAAFAEPFVLEGGEFFVSCCVGIAMNDHPTDAYGLIRDADAAMFSAKEGGRARHARFDEGMRERAVGRVTLEAELRRAIERDEFVLHYQPIVDLTSGDWAGAEALVRWEHPRRGLVAPGEFIPLAEENGLIVPLGLVILQKVVEERARWKTDRPLYASVNMSAVQLVDPTIPASVAAALRATGLDPELLVVEVTETAVMEELDAARKALEQIVATGVRVFIDDFGTGYSSIARLGELPMVGIKIDRSFTSELGRDAKARNVVGAVADLAHALNLQVVVEGIETEAASSTAHELHCDYGQGYHFARPAPADLFAGLLVSTE